MKYIRTNGGELFKVLNEREEYFNVYLLGKVVGAVFKGKVIKQADTIDKLCDEYVWRKITFDKGKDYKGNDCLINQDREKDEHKITQEMIKEGIYGAIWVKGEHDEPILKSVAKMNEKGELELL